MMRKVVSSRFFNIFWVVFLTAFTVAGRDSVAWGFTNTAPIVLISDSADHLYGIDRTDNVFNSGPITITNIFTTADARGIYVHDDAFSVTNTGSINATSSGGHYVEAHGIYIIGSGSVTNSGSINAKASGGDYVDARGIFINGGSSVTNSGSINAKATASGSTALSYGIYTYGGSVTNTASINITSNGPGDASAYGIISAYGVSNTASITATAGGADADVVGICTSGSVTNSGSITAMATASGAGYASVIGILTSGSVSNSGSIYATAHSEGNAHAYGIDAGDSSVTNSGSIYATAHSKGYARAYGIVRERGSSVTNSGSIYATAHSEGYAHAYGIAAIGDGSVSNSGTIRVKAVGLPASFAYGIYFGNGGFLTNSGVILASDGNARELYVHSDTVTMVGRYNMTLDGNPARGSLEVNSGAAFDLNNALFSVSAVPGTLFNTPYRIFDGAGAVNGAFSGVLAAQNPAVSVLYAGQGDPGSADDTVSLLYHPRTSPVLEGIGVSRRLLNASLEPGLQQQIKGFLERRYFDNEPLRLAAASTTATDAPAGLRGPSRSADAYIVPFYARVDNDSRLDYDADLYGFTAGYEKEFDAYRFGVHLGYGRADTDFSGREFPSRDTSIKQDQVSLGLQGMKHWDNWVLRGDVTGFYGWHEYSGVTGVYFEAREKADYESWGTMETLMGGYALKAGSNVFYPEIGLNHVWVHQEGFTAKSGLGGWPTKYSSEDEHLLQGLATMRWLYRFTLGDYSLTSSVLAGGRLYLSDDDLTIHQTVPGAPPVSVTDDQDRAAGLASVSLTLKKGDLTTELGYSGDYSGDTVTHGVWWKWIWAF